MDKKMKNVVPVLLPFVSLLVLVATRNVFVKTMRR